MRFISVMSGGSQLIPYLTLVLKTKTIHVDGRPKCIRALAAPTVLFANLRALRSRDADSFVGPWWLNPNKVINERMLRLSLILGNI